MGKLSSGLLGDFHGKVGPVIGSSMYGEPYIKARSKKRTGVVQPGEKANRQKFALAHRWLQPLLDFVRVGFSNYSPKVHGYNAAKSLLLKTAFRQQDGQLIIDPALVQLSHGNLPLPAEITVTRGPTQLVFTWNAQRVAIAEDPTDQAMLLAYDTESQDFEMTLTGHFRRDGHAELDLNHMTKSRLVHVYFAMVAHDHSQCSMSLYLGALEKN